MRDAILEFFRKNKGEFVSGQEMSEACNVSRTAIWKHIKILRDKGYKIESYTKKGYRLLSEPDLLSPLEMEKSLTTKTFGRNYIYLTKTESTSAKAKKEALEGAPEGTVVVTEEQSAGRGRLDRGWFSPFGKGIWFSLILRPDFLPMEAPKCTLMAAVALTKAFHRMGLAEAGIKWPNDILVNGKKIVGILTEMNASMEEIFYIVMGIGINVHVERTDLPEELQDIATSFSMEGIEIDRKELFTVVLEELESIYNRVLLDGFDTIIEEWKRLSVTLHKEIDVYAPGRTYRGVAVDVDRDGNLLVQTGPNTVERIIAGDVSIRPAKQN